MFMSLVSKKKSQFGREMSMSVNICKYFSPPSHTHPSANIWKVAKFLGRRNGRILYCVHPNTCQDWFGDNVETLIEYSHYMNPTQALPRRRLLLPAQFGGKRKRRIWLEPHLCRHPLPYMVTFHFYHVLFQYLVHNSEICIEIKVNF